MKRVTLLVGSPKPSRSVSSIVGGYLLDRLAGAGMMPRTEHLHTALRSPSAADALAESVDASDLVVLASPLYVDTLPAPVIRAMELLAGRRRAHECPTRPSLLAIINSGLPEPFQCDCAVATCRFFARDAQLDWRGGLRIGGGPVIGSGPLTARGPTRRLVKGLDLVADALASGLPIPAEALELVDRPLLPPRPYMVMADLTMWMAAYRQGVLGQIHARPYEKDRT